MNAVLLAVTGASLMLAGFMSAIAWRMSREERRRSDARVAILASAIYEDSDDTADTRLFHAHTTRSAARYGIAISAGVCLVAAVAALAVVATRRAARNSAPVIETRKPSDAPLELLALEHERDGGQLVVRGIIRNPAEARERDGLAVVVLLFGRDGQLISTARAAIPALRLGPGTSTPFVVNAGGADHVDRFRLSFRTDARVEPHIDRRTS